MKEKLRQLHQDSLVRNSFYLMLSTGAMAVAGFVFWLVAARLFTPHDIGVATTLISAMNLISYIGLLGLNSTFIRVLPESRRRSAEINTGLIVSTTITLFIALGYALIVPFITPALGVISSSPWHVVVFVVVVALASVNLLTDSIFVAMRAAKYNLLIDGILMSAVKLALPFVFVGLGAFGLFSAAGAAAVVALIASVYFLARRFDYKPKLQVHWHILRDVVRYSLANYLASLLNIAPTLVIPLIIIAHLGAASAGYYYLAFMVANLLYTVSFAATQSLFAEGSYADRRLRDLFKKSVSIIAALMVPAAVIIYFGAHLLLTIFGKAYATQAANLLQIFALAAPTVCAYIISVALLRITKQLAALIVVNAVYFVAVTGLTLLWINSGLLGVGYAWLIGNAIAGAAGLVFLLAHYKKQKILQAAV